MEFGPLEHLIEILKLFPQLMDYQLDQFQVHLRYFIKRFFPTSLNSILISLEFSSFTDNSRVFVLFYHSGNEDSQKMFDLKHFLLVIY